MTVASELNRKEYAGNGVTTAFATSPMVFFDASDLEVYDVLDSTGVATLKTITTDYTVSGGAGSTGTVTMLTAPASGHTLVIVRSLPLTQEDDFVQNDASDAEVVEDAFDRQTMVAQQLQAKVDRAVRLPDGDVSGADTELPPPEASTLLGWNADADAIINYSSGEISAAILVSAFMETLLDAAGGDAAFQTIVDSATAETAPATGDVVMVSDVSLTPDNGRKITLENVLKVVNGLTADALPVGSTDYMLSYDASASGAKKVLFHDFPLPLSHIAGLAYSNNAADATNDIDIAVGACRDSTDAVNMRLTSALTKRLDAAWAVGTAAGGLDTGVIGNSDYYIWLIKRSDTGVVDALFSLSATAPTMPPNYDYKRLIGWIRRSGGAILSFSAVETAGGGVESLWVDPPLDVDATEDTTANLRVLSVPVGVRVKAKINVLVDIGGGVNTGAVYVSSPDVNDEACSTTTSPLSTLRESSAAATQNPTGVGYLEVRTNTSAQVRTVAAAASTILRIATLGFEWSRR